MKKLILTFFACSLLTTAWADNWAVGAKLGAGENNPSSLKHVFNSATGTDRELEKNAAVFGVEAMYEWAFSAQEENKLGVKVGLDFYGQNQLELKSGNDLTYTETTFSLPLTVYYKRDNGLKNVSWFAGAGASVLHTEIETEWRGWTHQSTKTRVFPHVVIGAEYRFTRLFALGVEARYNFDAKVKKHGEVYSNRSGFGATVTGRFYF